MMPAFADLVLVGRVVKPHGRLGEVLVEPISDVPERFPTLARAFLPGTDGRPREVRVERVRPHQDRFIVKLAGVDTIEAAETMRGHELRIAEDELRALPGGSYYHHQLAGLRVLDTAGVPLGVVEDVVETGGEARVLVVRGPQGEETLLPFAVSFVRRVDLDGRVLVVERPEYVVAD